MHLLPVLQKTIDSDPGKLVLPILPCGLLLPARRSMAFAAGACPKRWRNASTAIQASGTAIGGHEPSQRGTSVGAVSRANQPNIPPKASQNTISPAKEMTRKVQTNSAGIAIASGLAGNSA